MLFKCLNLIEKSVSVPVGGEGTNRSDFNTDSQVRAGEFRVCPGRICVLRKQIIAANWPLSVAPLSSSLIPLKRNRISGAVSCAFARVNAYGSSDLRVCVTRHGGAD